jgi:hypothetical protein
VQPLQDWPERHEAAETLGDLVGDVAASRSGNTNTLALPPSGLSGHPTDSILKCCLIPMRGGGYPWKYLNRWEQAVY